jgi:putative hydrolase of the HAD superfamily
VVRTLGLPEEILPELNRYIDERFADPTIYTLFPDSLEAVRRLKDAGFTVGITSNWSWHLPEVCERLGLAPYLDFLVVSARVGAVKPHPRIFEETVESAGVPPEAIVHVGDDIEADVIGALQAGLRAALLDRAGKIPTDSLPEGVPVFENLLDFVGWATDGPLG